MKKTKLENIKEAAHALSDLNIYGAVIRLLEGGLHGPHPVANQIIKLAQTQIRRELHKYDKAMSIL